MPLLTSYGASSDGAPHTPENAPHGLGLRGNVLVHGLEAGFATSFRSPGYGLSRGESIFVPCRQEACGRGNVDVRDEQPLLAVWLVAEQRPVGPHNR